MPTSTEITNTIEDKIMDNIRVGQQAVVDCVRNWADTVETTFAKLPELAAAVAPLKGGSVLESTFGFTEQMVASQREFAWATRPWATRP